MNGAGKECLELFSLSLSRSAGPISSTPQPSFSNKPLRPLCFASPGSNPSRFGFFGDPRFGLRCDGLCCCSGDRQRNLDQLESLSKKLKAKTLITEAPAQSVSVE
ncbi:hypothetical protein Syun_029015 [Stephania yunnanensis]|uniref:Uncharacterized protein n=1 Tax=Stephania yunnanensis TaxID=152371 RepID=A0AAP0E4R2_9MAGN